MTESEVEELLEVIAKRCYKICDVEYLNGNQVLLFNFNEIKLIVDENFFEILPRFAEVEDEIYIDKFQMAEICEASAEKLKGEYGVCDRADFNEAREDYEYNCNPKYWD